MSGNSSREATAPASRKELCVPPHSIEAEQSVLGSLMFDAEAITEVSTLQEADFYRPSHGMIYAAICALAAAGEAIDVVTVSEKLGGKLAEVGGLAYLSELVRDTPSAANASAYAKIVREKALLRALAQLGHKLASAAYDTGSDASGLLARAQERLLDLASSARTGRGLVASPELVRDFIDDLDRRQGGHAGLQVGLADFDRLTHGLEPGDLVVIAGRPGMGKTALLVSVAATVSKASSVAVFSAEMPAQQLMRRCIALLGAIPQARLRHAEGLTDSDWKQIVDTASNVAALRLWIDDTSAPSLAHIRAECAARKAKGGLDLVLFDYLQLGRGEGKNRYEQLRDVAYGLKALAKDLGVPVIALAQLNRDVERREEQRPRLADLRDSGAIEEAADVIALLYREGYYDPGFGMPHAMECSIAKNRNAETGLCLWNFAGEYSQITMLEEAADRQYRHLLAERRVAKRRGAGADL
jgi:replicative DNA helicase